jgi:cytidylate kinase
MSFSIAIDGPAAAGKSTVAKQVAKILNCVYIDTGAMYRAITWYALSKGVDPKDEEKVTALLPEIDLSLHLDGKVVVNDQDITKEIRTTEVADNVSYIASYKKIRLHLVELQRKMSKNVSVVMDGRDIGSYVLPYADVKIFQVASVETRAVRRYKENLEKGINCSIEEIEENLRKRDYIDSHREFAPLKKAEDSFVLDTSNMTIDEAVNAIIKIVKNKLGEVK